MNVTQEGAWYARLPASSCNLCLGAAFQMPIDRTEGSAEDICEAELRPSDFEAACETAWGGNAHFKLS